MKGKKLILFYRRLRYQRSTYYKCFPDKGYAVKLSPDDNKIGIIAHSTFSSERSDVGTMLQSNEREFAEVRKQIMRELEKRW